MSNFFAQPNALAHKKTLQELQNENVPPHLIPLKTFSGNRPSFSLLLLSLNAYNNGQMDELMHEAELYRINWHLLHFLKDYISLDRCV
ncbi:hypothetical protein ACSBR1_000715 [Camellia fascicularis]